MTQLIIVRSVRKSVAWLSEVRIKSTIVRKEPQNIAGASVSLTRYQVVYL